MKFVKLHLFFFLYFFNTLNFYASSYPPLFTGEFEFRFYTENTSGTRTPFNGSVPMALYKVVNWGQEPLDRDYILEFVEPGSWDSSKRWIQAINSLSNNTTPSEAYIFSHIIGGSGEQRYCIIIDDNYFLYFTVGTQGDIDIDMVDRGSGWTYGWRGGNRDTEILTTGGFPGISQLNVMNSSTIGINWSNNSIYVDDVLYSSGTGLSVFTNSIHQVTRVEQSEVNNSKQFFTNWNIGNSSNSTVSVSVSSSTYNVIANFELRNKLAIQTSFWVEGTGGGIVNVDQIDYSVPTNDLFIRYDIDSLLIIAPLQQVKNEVWCNFDRWSDGVMSNSRIVNMNYPQTVTAQYIPSVARLAPMNAQIEGNEGEYVKVNWDEHTNPNVSQYKVWRKLKMVRNRRSD